MRPEFIGYYTDQQQQYPRSTYWCVSGRNLNPEYPRRVKVMLQAPQKRGAPLQPLYLVQKPGVRLYCDPDTGVIEEQIYRFQDFQFGIRGAWCVDADMFAVTSELIVVEHKSKSKLNTMQQRLFDENRIAYCIVRDLNSAKCKGNDRYNALGISDWREPIRATDYRKIYRNLKDSDNDSVYKCDTEQNRYWIGQREVDDWTADYCKRFGGKPFAKRA